MIKLLAITNRLERMKRSIARDDLGSYTREMLLADLNSVIDELKQCEHEWSVAQ